MTGIDHLRGGQPLSTQRSSQHKAPASGTHTQHSTSARQGDAVSLSEQGRNVGQLHQQLAAEPSFDSAKVAAIKEAIANGAYAIDAEKLADNLIKFEDELRGL
ncbi:flagellar biosynthesis anti-sigma factor FlgM [Thaumasiovibrio sp. DFM-14]|uniref:flagellar biosynthesis anti-sigma factor FlgM n=1 Tax=Thaumasiovibrio sp. DFM-14 TaxID=3384792 RepID=UPI00399F17B5